MRITGWNVDACGHLRDVGVEGVGPALTVLLGPNEAGKTTTHYFLRGVLFGFPDARSKPAQRYKPDRATVGGRVRLDHRGRLLQLERHGTSEPALVDPSGAPVGVTIEEILGGATRQLFEAVFAVEADDLRELGELNGVAVRERIFAASLSGGGRSARDAIAELDEHRSPIVRARSGRLRALRDELREAEAALEAARAESQKVPALEEAVAAARAAVARHAHALDDKRGRSAHLRRLCDHWQAWAQLDSLRAEHASLPGVDLGPDPSGHLEAALEARRATDETLDEVEHAMQLLRDELAGIVVDDNLLALASRIDAAREQLAGVSARSANLAQRAAGLATQRSILEQRCAQHLGIGWKPQDLDDIDISHPAQERLSRAASRLTEARRAVAEAEARADALAREHAALTRQLAARDADDVPPRLELPETTSLRAALADAQLLQRKLPELAAGRQAEALRSARPGGGPGWLVPTFGALAVLAAVATALAAMTGEFATAAATGTVTLVALVACVAASLASRPVGPPTIQSTGERIALLETQVATAAERLGFGPEPDRESVDALLAALPTAIGRHEAAQRDRDRLGELEGEVEEHRAATQDARDAFSGASEAWREAVASCGLPDDLAPETVSRLVQQIGDLRGDAERISADEVLLAREEDDLRSLARAHEVLLADAGALSTDGDEPLAELRLEPTEREDAMRRLVESLDDARETASRRLMLQDRAAETDLALVRAREAAEAAQRAVDDRLAHAGVADSDSYRALAGRVQRRDELAAEIERGEVALRSAFGAGEALERARGELAAADPEAWEQELERTRADMAKAEEAYEEAVRNEASLRRELDELERSARVAERSAHVESLRAEAAELVREWTVLSMARNAIERTLDVFERERQPEVVRDASASFGRVTGQRWDALLPGSDGELAVLGGSGARLDAKHLSRGATEQLYLSMRLALARAHAAKAESLPLLLDDVLVNADDARRERLAAELGRLADHLQVIVFTASESTAELLARARPDTVVVDFHAGHGTARGTADRDER